MFRLVAVALVAICLVAAPLFAQKSICPAAGLNDNGTKIYPNKIPNSILTGMSSRQGGNFTFEISICAAADSKACKGKGFVALINATSQQCVRGFDRAIGRPTVIKRGAKFGLRGFKALYASTASRALNKTDVLELIVLCSYRTRKDTTNGALTSRSHRFAARPNKFNGQTVMLMAHSTICHSSLPHHVTRPHHSINPSHHASHEVTGVTHHHWTHGNHSHHAHTRPAHTLHPRTRQPEEPML